MPHVSNKADINTVDGLNSSMWVWWRNLQRRPQEASWGLDKSSDETRSAFKTRHVGIPCRLGRGPRGQRALQLLAPPSRLQSTKRSRCASWGSVLQVSSPTPHVETINYGMSAQAPVELSSHKAAGGSEAARPLLRLHLPAIQVTQLRPPAIAVCSQLSPCCVMLLAAACGQHDRQEFITPQSPNLLDGALGLRQAK